MSLRTSIESKQAKIGIVGLGYVGLPLILAYSRAGHASIGFDIDPAKQEHLLAGRSYIKHIPPNRSGKPGLLERSTRRPTSRGWASVMP